MTPLVFSTRFKDSFRVPKELFTRLEIFVVVALAGLASVRRGSISWMANRRDPAVWLTALILGWAAFTTLTSVNIAISAESMFRTAGFCVLFLLTLLVAGRYSFGAIIAAILVPALINSILFLLEELQIWNPFFSQEYLRTFLAVSGRDVSLESHRFSIALLGNTNDVGGYLAISAIAAAALLGGSRKYRSLLAPATLLLLLCVILSRSATAIVALSAGLVSLTFLVSRRAGVVAMLILPLLVGGTALVYRPVGVRLQTLVDSVRKGNYDSALSNRTVPFLAAMAMARDHPITGIGPGCFTFEYFRYRQRLESRFPTLLGMGEVGVSFGEVHNDHLQVLAETGVPGLFVMWAALLFIARRSFHANDERKAPDSEKSKAGWLLALPGTITFAVLALGQFPLELAASANLLVFLGAISLAWTTDASA